MRLSPKAKAALQKVVDKFESGDLSAIVSITKTQLPPDAPAIKWSFSNRVMAYAQTSSVDCRGYRQWQTAGRQVRKGSHAAYILGPVIIKKQTDDGGEEERLVGFRCIPVFAYQDTESENGEALDYIPKELPPLMDVARHLGVDVTYAPTRLGALGNCTPDGAAITLGSEDPSVFFHELGHAAHARIEGSLKGGQDEQQETAADFVATVLMHFYGLGDRTGNCWQYISMYAKEPIVAITKALSTVEKVLALLLNAAETTSCTISQ